MMTAQRYREQPADPAHPATQVEHGYAGGTDASSAARCPEHAGTHELLLAHVRAGRGAASLALCSAARNGARWFCLLPEFPPQPAIVPGRTLFIAPPDLSS
jgi:hypothetical protein